MDFEPRKLSFQYVRHGAAEALLDFLAYRFRYHTAPEWAERIASGSITVDDATVSPKHQLRSGERIVYIPPRVAEPPVDTRYTVLYEDNYLLAVSKSGNIPTSPSGKYWHNCLRHVLQRERGLPKLLSVHRLDRETSGVNLFAKTPEAASALGKAFAQGRVLKRYQAVLRGYLPAADIFVNAPLQEEGGEITIKQAVHPDGRASITRFRLNRKLNGACLVDVLPQTGRTHQIRAHASFLGSPVWGDHLYGASDEEFIRWVRIPHRDASHRHLLHAAGLSFAHPVSGELLEVEDSGGKLVEEWRAVR
jgi:RluA family pseudouridine synthase